MKTFRVGSASKAQVSRGAVALVCVIAVAGVYQASVVHAQARAGAAATAPVPLPPAPDLPGRSLGFLVTYFSLAMHQGDDACPKGLNQVLTSDAFLATQSPAERARLEENQREMYRKMVQRGPKGENVCKVHSASKDALLVTMSGNRNDGLDLDGWNGAGRAPVGTCAQKQYIGDDGARGVDNQLGRIHACLAGFREKDGAMAAYQLEQMRSSQWMILIEVSGVQDTRNDPDVVVDVYGGKDPMVKDPAGNILSGASLSPKNDRKWHARLSGRILNGVIEARSGDKLVIPNGFVAALPPYAIHQPQVRLTLQADGGAKGYLGGYRDLDELDVSSMDGSQENTSGYSCDGMYNTLRKFADGGRNAAGACDRISAAYRVRAIPTFVVHPERTTQVSSR
jgi:hypothetical protein